MKKVLLGMSGGIDSSSAAILLKEKGFKVLGITFNLLGRTGFSEEAKKFCKLNNIKHYEVDYSGIFKNKVISYFIQDYKAGNTPNPCVVCNKLIKFPLLWEEAKKHDCDYIATGHYARITKYKDNFYISKGIDSLKDQSYFLFSIPPTLIDKVIFPLGDFCKKDIKSNFFKYGISHNKIKESQDICFVDNDYRDILAFKSFKGLFIDRRNNKTIGYHKGYYNYTIGQRKGLGLGHHERLYVSKIDAKNNIVYLDEKSNLYTDRLSLKDLNIFNKEILLNEENLYFKFRYTQKELKGECSFYSGKLEIKLNEPVFAICKGQAGVVYYNDMIIAGGWINT